MVFKSINMPHLIFFTCQKTIFLCVMLTDFWKACWFLWSPTKIKLLESMLEFGEFGVWFGVFLVWSDLVWFGLDGWGFFWGGCFVFCKQEHRNIQCKVKECSFLLMNVSAYENAHLSCWRHFCLGFFQRNPPIHTICITGGMLQSCQTLLRDKTRAMGTSWEMRDSIWTQEKNFFTGKVLKHCQFVQKGYGVSLEIFESHLDTDLGKLSSWPCVSRRGVLDDIKRSFPTTKILWLEL